MQRTRPKYYKTFSPGSWRMKDFMWELGLRYQAGTSTRWKTGSLRK
jgi:hypothetical protein